MRDQIDKLDSNEHKQIFNIIKKYVSPDTLTKTQTGYIVPSDILNEECLKEVYEYVIFCSEQHKRMNDDNKLRKKYERMV